jgi:hypothetical protein
MHDHILPNAAVTREYGRRVDYGTKSGTPLFRFLNEAKFYARSGNRCDRIYFLLTGVEPVNVTKDGESVYLLAGLSPYRFHNIPKNFIPCS